MGRLEQRMQKVMERFLDGPATYQLAMLRPREGEYRSSAIALYAWGIGILQLFLSQTAIWLLPGAFLIVLLASLAMDSLMRGLLLTLPALFITDFLLGWLFRPKLEISRRQPERVRAGSSFTTELRIRNRRRFIPAWNLQADPFAYGPGLRDEPGSELPDLPPRAEATLTKRTLALRRGSYRLYRPRVYSRFPFDLIKWSCRGAETNARLIVYPAYTSLTDLTLPLGARSQSAGTAAYSKIGESLEVRGVRDFRSGDDVRWIDWAGSARTGEFVVKEFEDECLKRVSLVVDTYIPPPDFWSLKFGRRKSDALEAALCLTAAIAEYLSRGEAVIELFAAGPRIYHLETGRHSGSFESVCDILSIIEPSATPGLDALEPEVFRDFTAVGGAVVILLDCDETRRLFIEKLRSRHIALRIIVVSEQPPEMPPDWLHLTPQAILAGTVTAL